MALVTCRKCNKQISDTAKVCPNCGVKKPLNVMNWALYIVPFIVLLAVALYYGNNENTPPAPLEKEAENVPKIKATEKVTEPVIEQLPIENTWQYENVIDDTSGKKFIGGYVTSNNNYELDPPYSGGTSAYLMLNKHPRFGTKVTIQVNTGQLHCQYNDCYVDVRFDDEEVIKQYVNGAADSSNNMYFFRNTNKVINKIKSSKKMYVELTFFQQGAKTFEFNTENLDLNKIIN